MRWDDINRDLAFAGRAQVLRWYLALNDGGVVHTEDELFKVRRLLNKADG